MLRLGCASATMCHALHCTYAEACSVAQNDTPAAHSSLVSWSVSGKESQPRHAVSARQLLVKQINYFSRLVLLGAIRVNGLGCGGRRSGAPGASVAALLLPS